MQDTNKTYQPLTNNKYKTLKISVNYSLGGMNYFSGNYERRGIYCHLNPVNRGNGFEESTLMGNQQESGYKILLEELKRKKQSAIDLHFKRINKLAIEIAKLYDKGDNQAIFKLIEPI